MLRWWHLKLLPCKPCILPNPHIFHKTNRTCFSYLIQIWLQVTKIMSNSSWGGPFLLVTSTRWNESIYRCLTSLQLILYVHVWILLRRVKLYLYPQNLLYLKYNILIWYRECYSSNYLTKYFIKFTIELGKVNRMNTFFPKLSTEYLSIYYI